MTSTRLLLNLTFIISLFITPKFANAQDAPAEEKEPSIYVQALNQYARWIKKFEPETDTLYFEELRGITTLFPKQVDDLTVTILTGRNQRKIYSDHNGKMTQRKMTPAQVSGKQLEIGIIPYQGRLDATRGVILSLSKWHAVIFEYNPKSERFEYARFENR